MGPHLQRWLTALLLLPALLLVIGYGSLIIFSLLIAAVAVLALTEFYQLVLGPGYRGEKVFGITLSLLIIVSIHLGDTTLILALLTLSVPLIFIFYLWSAQRNPVQLAVLTNLAFGLFYITLTLSHLILIRQGPKGILWVYFILVLAFAGDTVAYYIGKHLGRQKLSPAISPGKTIEGTVGLIAGSTIACVLFKLCFFPSLPLVHTLILGLLGSVVGQLGDLSESLVKRYLKVKDSGSLLPGHGGLLDRIDCLLFIIPFVYYYRLFVLS